MGLCVCVWSQPFGYFLLNGILIEMSIDGFLPAGKSESGEGETSIAAEYQDM